MLSPGPPRPLLPWPALTYEEQTWTSTLPRDQLPRAVRRRLAEPYEAAVVPRVADRDVPLPRALATLESEASAEIARFDAEVGAELAPFASVLLRSESASSSRIENLPLFF